MTLTSKQEAFCQAIASGSTQADAYKASYSAANMSDNAIYREASLLMDAPKIAQRIKELRGELQKRQLWTREMSVKGLVAAYKIANEDRNTTGMVNSVKELNVMHGFNEPTKIDVGGSLLDIFAQAIKDDGGGD